MIDECRSEKYRLKKDDRPIVFDTTLTPNGMVPREKERALWVFTFSVK